MTKTPDMTSAYTYHADVVANAVRFTVSLFLGVGKYDNREATSLDEALAFGKEMIEAHPNVRSKPIVTAFDAAGNSVVIGEEYRAGKKKSGGKKKGGGKKDSGNAPKPPAEAPAEPPPAAAKGRRGPGKGKAPAKGRKRPVTAAAPLHKASPAGHAYSERWTPALERRWADEAAAGRLPPAPDFSAPTHASYRKRRDDVVKAAEDGDLKTLRSFNIQPLSSSRVILHRYREYAVKAIEARKRNGTRKRQPAEPVISG